MKSMNFTAVALAASLLVCAPAYAVETTAYTPAAFAAAQKAKKPTLVEIHAPWCGTCKAQALILAEIESQAEYKELVVLHVDFDSQKDVVKRLGATRQSTLIVFKDGKEADRSVGDANPESNRGARRQSVLTRLSHAKRQHRTRSVRGGPVGSLSLRFAASSYCGGSGGERA